MVILGSSFLIALPQRSSEPQVASLPLFHSPAAGSALTINQTMSALRLNPTTCLYCLVNAQVFTGTHSDSLNSFLGGSFLLFKPFESMASLGSLYFFSLFSGRHVCVFQEVTARCSGLSLKVSSSEAFLTGQVAWLSGIHSLPALPHHCASPLTYCSASSA